MVVLKDVILAVSDLGVCGGLGRTDFDHFPLGWVG